MGGQLCDIFDFHVLPFMGWRGIFRNGFQHILVEKGRFHFLHAVMIYLHGSFQHLEDTLLADG